MGKTRGSREAGKTGSRGKSQEIPTQSSREVAEALVPGSIPRFEIPGWRDQYGIVAGITGRGAEPGRGFDLGLWSREPVGEVMSRWLAFWRAMDGFPAVALGNQVHGVELMDLDSGRGWVYVDGVDGWITRSSGILLTVTVADCIPVYLVAPGRGIALLHAGWKGTAGGILGRGVERLGSVTKTAPGKLIMHCGVGICGPCYEVGAEVMAGCGVAPAGPGPWQLDLRSTLLEQAGKMGLTKMTASAWCSAHDRDRFYSHRASQGVDGRMVAYIGMLPCPPGNSGT
jgi:polyphenol oxidase